MAQGAGFYSAAPLEKIPSPYGARKNTVRVDSYLELSIKELKSMTNRELIDLAWDHFGVAIDYDSEKEDILKRIYAIAI